MKSFKNLGLALALLFLVSLAGCNISNNPSGGSDPEVIEPEADPVLVSIAVSGEFKTEYEVGEEFDSTGVIVTASYDKGEPKVVTEETVFSGFDSSVVGPCIVTATYKEKTAEIELTIVESVVVYSADDVAAVFNEGISVYGLSASFYDIEGVFTGWYLGVSFGASEDDSEENLGGAVYTLASFLPEYLVVFDEGYEAATEEKPAQYSLILVDESLSVGVELYSFLDEGLLISEIYIYDIAE